MKTTADAKRSRISQELLQSCGGLLQNATPFTSQKLANPHQIDKTQMSAVSAKVATHDTSSQVKKK